MKTITNDGASRSSVDHIVHKTHDGLFASTYYINYNFDANSIQNLRLGAAMPENGVDLEYMVSFPSGTQVVSNSTKPTISQYLFVAAVRFESFDDKPAGDGVA